MKKYFLLIILNLNVSGQELMIGELRIHLINICQPGGTADISLEAGKEYSLVYSPLCYINCPEYPQNYWGQIIASDNSVFNHVIASKHISNYNPLNDYSIYFDFENDYGISCLGLSIYKLFSSGKECQIIINTLHCGNWVDTEITYDVTSDKFFYGNCDYESEGCFNEINDTIVPFNTQEVDCFELWLDYENYNGHPKLTWNH
ncbi:MAG: hypothetical protein HXY49_07975 [Ignavibacteriaceae bacterium]|nr:hypothetical protein [Ignavibacteriaceae bacterium]